MNIRHYLKKRNIVIGCVIFVTLLVMFVLYNNLYFRLKNTTPPIDRVADSTIEFQYHFSQPLKSVGQVTINDHVVDDVVIDGATLKIPLEINLEEGVDYSIALKSIESQWFGNKITVIEQVFTPQYIEFSSLSNEEKQTQISASHSGQVDDPFISDNVFPMFNDRWQIEATVITDSRSVILNVTFFAEVPDYDNGGVVKKVSNEIAESYRQEVLDEIKKRGADPENYTILYTNEYLYEKYNEHPTH